MYINGVEYVVGLNRIPGAETRYRAHLYRGTSDNPGEPMCRLGWNRDYGESYSIWRNRPGLGVCRVCFRRADNGSPPVPPKSDVLRWSASPREWR
jgi:hypothetical protein